MSSTPTLQIARSRSFSLIWNSANQPIVDNLPYTSVLLTQRLKSITEKFRYQPDKKTLEPDRHAQRDHDVSHTRISKQVHSKQKKMQDNDFVVVSFSDPISAMWSRRGSAEGFRKCRQGSSGGSGTRTRLRGRRGVEGGVFLLSVLDTRSKPRSQESVEGGGGGVSGGEGASRLS